MNSERRGRMSSKAMVRIVAATTIGIAASCEHYIGGRDYEDFPDSGACGEVVVDINTVDGVDEAEAIKTSKELLPVWHLSRTEEMDVFYGIELSENKERAVLGFAAVYVDGDLGASGIGISIENIYAARFPGGVWERLDIAFDAHGEEDVEMVYLGLQMKTDKIWELEKVFINRHGRLAKYDIGEMDCVDGDHVALAVDRGKHTTYASVEECNENANWEVLGVRLVTSSMCGLRSSDPVALVEENYVGSVGEDGKIYEAKFKREDILVQPWGECHYMNEEKVCRAKFGFNVMRELADVGW